MRYRLIATYRGAPYQASLGPGGGDVTLFAACPPPEELGFGSAAGHWRKQVPVTDLDDLRRSRPTGVYRGERCLVLDDQGERLHIAYLGDDPELARELGYWEIDREVFEVVVARANVTDLTEEQLDVPPSAVFIPPPPAPVHTPPVHTPPVHNPPVHTPPVLTAPVPVPQEPERSEPGPQSQPQSGAYHPPEQSNGYHLPPTPDRMAAWHGSPEPEPWTPMLASANGTPLSATAGSARTSRSDRITIQSVFDELLDLAAIPQSSYAVDDEVPGAMCLLKTDGGFEVFSSSDDARHEVRFFDDEEAAYFYLFGVLAAEAVRNGYLRPAAARNGVVPTENVSKYLRE
jgi:hypothetical protein